MTRFDKISQAQRRRPWLRLGIFLAFLGLCMPAGGWAQVPPDEAWRTLHTQHFRVTYPDGMEKMARRAGHHAEKAWRLLEERFVEAPSGTVDLVLTDHADISNGYTNVFPSNRIVIFAPPPLDDYSLSPMDQWLELVITHELVHTFHFDLARGPGRVVRSVFGRLPVSWPSFAGAATPGWAVEGVATYFESALTRAGRIRGSHHDMILRTAVLEEAFPSLNQVSGNTPSWPGGQRYYVYGSLFLDHLLDRHGEKAMGRFAEAVAGQWVPYRLDSAAEDAFGQSFSESWEEWRRHLDNRYHELEAELKARGPLTVPETLTRQGYYALSPAMDPSGEHLAFGRFDARSDLQIRTLAPDGSASRKVTRVNSLSALDWTPDGRVLFSQLEYADPYRIQGDLYLADLEGNVVRLTEGERLDHPHASHHGEWAAAIQEGGGTNRVVLVELETGRVRPLTPFDPLTHWAYPQWSPDGRWIAAVRWRPGAYQDIVLLNREGEVVHQVTRDRAVDLTPAWDPQGRWLLWSSDRSGIPNLYAVELDPATGAPGPRRQITNLLGGAAHPEVGPRGEWLYFSGYHHDGWHIERIPFRPESWFHPHPPDPDFALAVDSLSRQADSLLEADSLYLQADSPAHAPGFNGQDPDYSPLSTLRPTYWSPAYRSGDEAGPRRVLDPAFGFSTSGRDLVGRHGYRILGLFSRGPATFNGGASYTYSGLGNPWLSLSFNQTHDAEGPFLAPDESQRNLFVVEAERRLALGTTFTRRRARTLASLGISGSHIWEDRSLLDDELRESRDFRLTRPDSRLAQGRIAFTFANARRYPFSVSAEDGVNLFIQGRARRHLALSDSLRGVPAEDRSYRDLTGQLALYQSLPLPGFGNHVLALRGSGGMAGGPGADAYHFEVGGPSGGGGPLSMVQLGEYLLYPVRGYATARRFGRYAWSASAEYRFPLWFINGGPGLLPIHLDWLSGTLFVDSGNAWGPELDLDGYRNPRREALASLGGELMLRLMPLWYGNLEVRAGAALPLVEGDGARFYLRLGPSF